MAEEVVCVSASSSDGERSGGWLCRRRVSRRKRRQRCLQDPVEIIDLTGDDCFIVKTTAYSDLDIIDLTEAEEPIVSPLRGSGYVTQNLKHSSPAGPQPVGSPKILTTSDPAIHLDVSLSTRSEDCVLISPKKGAVGKPYFQSTTDCDGDLESSNHTMYNSDLGSLESSPLESGIFSFSPANESNECQATLNRVEEPPNPCLLDGAPIPQPSPPLQRHCPSPVLCCSPVSVSPSQADTVQPLLEAKNTAPNAVTLDVQEPAKRIDIKVWLKTLQYFQGSPVHHPFLQNVVQAATQLKANQITCQSLSMVSSTIEENFFQGTLDFLMGYVSPCCYPPKEVTDFVVRKILLSPKHEDVQEEIWKDAYKLLVKIQALHPAKVDTVVWDWPLLCEVMEEEGPPYNLKPLTATPPATVQRSLEMNQTDHRAGLEMAASANERCKSSLFINLEGKFPGRLLFLQYVIQTLDDDFQRTIRIGLLHKSIAKSVLSCDCCFSNIREVTEWLISSATGIRLSQYRLHLQRTRSPSLETSQDESSTSTPHLHLDQTAQRDNASSQQTKMEVALLQRMLSIAVEVDKSPNCSAHKIACMVFSSLLNIPTRSQREDFLSSMECHLLRCKVLELIFHHCTVPTDEPLSFMTILHFLQSFSLQLIRQDSGATWQGWDEMLHYLNLLLLSYRSIVLGHLRSPIYERVNLIIKGAKPKLQSKDCIKESDVKCRIQSFKKRISKTIGERIPSPIIEKIQLLELMLLTSLDIEKDDCWTAEKASFKQKQ